jgi:hypothetical protein
MALLWLWGEGRCGEKENNTSFDSFYRWLAGGVAWGRCHPTNRAAATAWCGGSKSPVGGTRHRRQGVALVDDMRIWVAIE